MNIKSIAVFASLAMAAAGCSQQSAPDAATGTADEEPAAIEQVARQPDAAALQEALPEGVQLDFGYHVRGDRVVEREGQRARRRVAMEYLDGDQETVFASIGKSLAAAGFELRDRKDLDNGNIRAKFSKARYGVAIVTVTAGMDDKARNPAAVGRIVLDWPMPRTRGQEAN